MTDSNWGWGINSQTGPAFFNRVQSPETQTEWIEIGTTSNTSYTPMTYEYRDYELRRLLNQQQAMYATYQPVAPPSDYQTTQETSMKFSVGDLVRVVGDPQSALLRGWRNRQATLEITGIAANGGIHARELTTGISTADSADRPRRADLFEKIE